MSEYFKISCSEDGDVSVHAYTKEELVAELGRRTELGEPAPKFCAAIPGSDPQYWDGKSVVIKGEIVVPAARRVVESWELP